MVSQTKTLALAFTLWAIFQPFFYPAPTGLTPDGPLLARLYYPFFHVGIIHALLNSWCLLSIVFLFPTTIKRLLLAYVIAVSVPDFCLAPANSSLLTLNSSLHVVGLSGVCYALMGMLTFSVRRPLYWQRYLWLTIAIGLLIPNMAVGVHAYCFAVGTLIAALNTPFIHKTPR